MRHARLLEWFEALAPGVKPRPRVEVWPRGGAKSSTGALGVVRLGAREVEWTTERADEEGNVRRVVELRPPRRFVLYVSGTQGQANKHVAGIATKFEQLGVSRMVGAYGNSKGWKVDLLRTLTGFNVLALGLDAAARGLKLDDFRPDLIIFDDIDSRHDSPEVVQKKIETITDSILPAGSSDCAVLFLQNKIHGDSVVSQLCDGRAGFLLTREPAAIEPAVYDLEIERVEGEDGEYSYRIAFGRASWAGQDLATCESQINDWGRAAFLREANHETGEDEDGLWQRERDIELFRVARAEVPDLVRIGVGVDPSASADGSGDEAGIVVAGIGYVGDVLHGYVLADLSLSGSPKKWAGEAVNGYLNFGGDVLVAEANNGGAMVEVTIGTVPGAPKVTLVHASRGKQTRAEPVQKLAEDGRLHHVGEFEKLEKEQCTWKPGMPSPNRLDALVWIITELMLREAPKRAARKSGSSGFRTTR